MTCHGGLRLIEPCAALLAGVSLIAPSAAVAQRAPTVQATPAKLDELKKHDEELKSLRDAQKKSVESEAAIKREIEEIGADRRKLNQSLIDTAARLRGLEDKIAASQQRLEPLENQERTLRSSLDAHRATIGEVLAALQRIGRRPPPALLASPEDALQAVRTAIVLGAVLPEMRQQVETLATNLNGLIAVRKQIASERDRLKHELASLDEDRNRVNALIAQRQKQQTEHEKALQTERAHATDLAHQADNLKDLIAKLEQGLDQNTRESREAARAPERPSTTTLHDPGRLAPAVAFASLRGHLPIPVNGVKLKEFGDPDGMGGTEKGVSIATRAGAQITAPADGWVVYAGPFRSYGQLLILNVGGGYHVLLAGMDRISVDLGQFVLTGEPVAEMGSGSRIAAIIATGSSQPVLYIELRKDGSPVDPGPWWAAGEGEKVRG